MYYSPVHVQDTFPYPGDCSYASRLHKLLMVVQRGVKSGRLVFHCNEWLLVLLCFRFYHLIHIYFSSRFSFCSGICQPFTWHSQTIFLLMNSPVLLDGPVNSSYKHPKSHCGTFIVIRFLHGQEANPSPILMYCIFICSSMKSDQGLWEMLNSILFMIH